MTWYWKADPCPLNSYDWKRKSTLTPVDCVAASVCGTTHTVSHFAHLVMTPEVMCPCVWMRAWADTWHLSQMPETHLQTWWGLSHHFSHNHALQSWGWRCSVRSRCCCKWNSRERISFCFPTAKARGGPVARQHKFKLNRKFGAESTSRTLETCWVHIRYSSQCTLTLAPKPPGHHPPIVASK